MGRTQAKGAGIVIPCSQTQKEAIRIAARERRTAMGHLVFDCLRRYERDYEPLQDGDEDVLVAADVLSWTRADLAADQGAREARTALRSIKRLERTLPGAPDLACADAAAHETLETLEEVFDLLDSVGEQAHVSDPTWLFPLEGKTRRRDHDEQEDPCRS